MDDTSDTPPGPGILAAGTVLLFAGLLGIVLLATNSDIALADELEPVARRVDESGNRGFYTFIVFWAIMISLVSAGLAAVGQLVARSGGVARALGSTAAALMVLSGAMMLVVPVVYSALINTWDADIEGDTLTDGGYAVDVLESIPFGASQAGVGILLVGLVVLAAAFFVSDEMNWAIGVPPLILSFFLIAVLEEGKGVSNVMVPVTALVVGIPVALYGWAVRRGARPNPPALTTQG